MRSSLALLPSILFALIACGEPAPDAADAFESSVETDLEALARTAADLATDALDEVVEEGCLPSVGGCEACFTTDGGTLNGTFALSVAETPCSATVGRRNNWTYSVQQSAFEGSWSTGFAGVTVEMSGSRTASITLDSPDRNESWDSAVEVEVLALSTDFNGGVTGWNATLAYSGFGGRVAAVEVVDDGTSLTGTATLTGPNDAVTCTVTGTREAPEVSCDPLEA